MNLKCLTSSCRNVAKSVVFIRHDPSTYHEGAHSHRAGPEVPTLGSACLGGPQKVPRPSVPQFPYPDSRESSRTGCWKD